MCELCGAAHGDMVTNHGHTVCASQRWCLLYMVRTADDDEVEHMHSTALQRLTRTLGPPKPPRRYFDRATPVGRSARSLYEVPTATTTQ